MPVFIPCETCGKPAREVGWPADCPKCQKRLCEECCDRKEAAVSWNTPKYAALPEHELPEVLTGAVDSSNGPGTVYLLAVRVGFGTVYAFTTRGPVALPWDWFEPSGDGTEPEFEDPAIVDHGQTLRLGKYEASVNALWAEAEGAP